jgi:hypothetical protein
MSRSALKAIFATCVFTLTLQPVIAEAQIVRPLNPSIGRPSRPPTTIAQNPVAPGNAGNASPIAGGPVVSGGVGDGGGNTTAIAGRGVEAPARWRRFARVTPLPADGQLPCGRFYTVAYFLQNVTTGALVATKPSGPTQIGRYVDRTPNQEPKGPSPFFQIGQVTILSHGDPSQDVAGLLGLDMSSDPARPITDPPAVERPSLFIGQCG